MTNRRNAHKYYIQPQFLTACSNIMFEESVCQNHIACLTTSSIMALRKNKVNVCHTKIRNIFSRNKNTSTEPHNYPRKLVFL